jgi:hypothetical protein
LAFLFIIHVIGERNDLKLFFEYFIHGLGLQQENMKYDVIHDHANL